MSGCCIDTGNERLTGKYAKKTYFLVEEHMSVCIQSFANWRKHNLKVNSCSLKKKCFCRCISYRGCAFINENAKSSPVLSLSEP